MSSFLTDANHFFDQSYKQWTDEGECTSLRKREEQIESVMLNHYSAKFRPNELCEASHIPLSPLSRHSFSTSSYQDVLSFALGTSFRLSYEYNKNRWIWAFAFRRSPWKCIPHPSRGSCKITFFLPLLKPPRLHVLHMSLTASAAQYPSYSAFYIKKDGKVANENCPRSPACISAPQFSPSGHKMIVNYHSTLPENADGA